MRRQLYRTGGVTRQNYGLGSWVKKKIRKLIPNELADVASKAAPFVAPFNPGIAGLMRGIGRFDQRGSLSDALKQGLMTYGGGEGVRRLGGLEGFTSGNQYSMDKFKEGPVGRLFQGQEKTLTEGNPNFTRGDADKGTLLGTKPTSVPGIVKENIDFMDSIPIIRDLNDFAKQQILVGGVSGAATYVYEKFLAEEPPQEDTETFEQYKERRRISVGNKMRTYFDNYFKFDKDYSSMTDEQKNALVARHNMYQGGRVGYQTGGISMSNTLAQNIAANRAQAAGIQTMLQAARSKLPGATSQAAPAGITSVPTKQAMPSTMRADIGDLTRSFDPTGRSDARNSLIGGPPSGVQTISPNRKPIDYSKFTQTPGPPPRMPGMGGMNQEDFMKLSETEQMKAMDADFAREQADMAKYGSFYTPEGESPRSISVNTGKQAYRDILFAMQMDYPEAYANLTGNETLEELDKLSGQLAGYYSKGGRVGLAFGGEPEAGINSLDAGAMDITYKGERPSKKQEMLMAGPDWYIKRIELLMDEYGYDYDEAGEIAYDSNKYYEVIGIDPGGIGDETRAPMTPQDIQMAAHGGRIGYDDGGLGFKTNNALNQKSLDLFGVLFNFLNDKQKKTVTQRVGNAQGGRIGQMGGTGPNGLPGIPRMASDGMEFDMRQNGGFQGLGAKEGKDDVPAMLAKNEFVFTADAVKGAGDGDVEKGAQRMYDTMQKLERRMA